jgi:hypothetical protein
MFNFVKLTLLTATLSTGVFAQDIGPLDDGTAVCGVPVCEITTTMTALSELDENQRYNYTNKLVYTYAESKDANVLENLMAVAREIKTLTTDLGDADWVIREASTLLNNSVFNLAKYSPVDADKLTGLFKQLDNQTKRYEVIAYWQNELANIEDLAVLNDLVLFSLNAKEVSIAAGDEAWVPRAASSLASEITVKLTALDPVHEGVYTVKMMDNTKGVAFDKVVVLDSSSEENLVVMFLNSKFNKVAYSYTNAKIIGNTIEGKLISNGSLSSTVKMTVDRATGMLTGTITSTRDDAISFEGSQDFSTREVFAGNSPVTVTKEDILKPLRGEILGIAGTLKLKEFNPGVYAASFVADNGFVVINMVGKFYAKNAVLSLTHKNMVKLVLALRDTEEGVMWRGSSFSTKNGAVAPATFK